MKLPPSTVIECRYYCGKPFMQIEVSVQLNSPEDVAAFARLVTKILAPLMALSGPEKPTDETPVT